MTGSVELTFPEPGVALLAIDNPPVNAMSASMLATMNDRVAEAQVDDAIRAIVITGRGRAFCSGADLKEPVAGRRAAEGEGPSGFGLLFELLTSSRAPVIGAINGLCIGGGLELALSCDVRIASTEASFTAAGVNVGLMASAYRLPRLIGTSRAKAMLLTGLPHDAATAERWGLVTALHEPGELLGAALRLAHRIAGRAPLSVEATKRVVDASFDLAPDAADSMMRHELSTLITSNDHREAVQAFRDRRSPDFTRS